MKDDCCSEQLRRKMAAERSEFDWLEEMGEAFSLEQESKIVSRCMRPACRVPIKWVGIPLQRGAHFGMMCVGADALSIIHPLGQIRVSVSCFGAQMLCDGLGLQMPTPLMVDRIWDHASLRIEPKTYLPDGQGYVRVTDRDGVTRHVKMMGMTAMVAHSDRIQAALEGAPELVGNVGKFWVICKALAGQSEPYGPDVRYKAANYGWFSSRAPNLSVTGEKLWQSIGTRHNQFHRDYSQTFVPIGRFMLVDGQTRPVREVLADPAVCDLISHEGPLGFGRHPNLPELGLFNSCISPDPKSVPVLRGSDEEPPTTPSGAKKRAYFIQAKNFRAVKSRQIDLIVIHSMEAREKPGTARAVANWFAGSNAPRASAHFCVDASDTVQCVQEHDVAWAAPGTNHNGIHLEHAGYASQSPTQWDDVYSRSMLKRSAKLAANICKRYELPVCFVDFEGLLEGRKGITTHAEVTRACSAAKTRGLTSSSFFKAHTTHTDPGQHFPMSDYLLSIGRYSEIVHA